MTQTPDIPSSADTARRWRDDPLSVFLAIAAVVLGLMYVLEQRDADTLAEASARAKQLGATTLDLDGCTAASASTDGATLVIACSSPARDAATQAATSSPDLTGFQSVVFVGNDVQLHCSVNPPDWPNGCTERKLANTEVPGSPE